MVELPSLRAAIRHALPVVVEGVLAPLALFYLFLTLAGIRGACLAGLGWSCTALVRRFVRRQRIPATLVLGFLTLAFRTGLTLATGSAFLYFVQPAAGTALLAVVVLGTALVRRPFIERLAHDYCPFDPAFFRRPAIRRFFLQISVLWGVVLLANASFVMWLLLTTSIRVFVLERALVTWSLTAAGIVASTMWFVRAMRRERVRVRFTGRVPVSPTA